MLSTLLLLACSGPAVVEAPVGPVELPEFGDLEAQPEGRRVGQIAPDGALPRLDVAGEFRLSDTLDAEDSRGALVVFMASHCGACAESLPQLVDLQARYAPEGLEVVVYGTDVNRLGWKKLVDKVRAAGLEVPIVMAPPYAQSAWLGEKRAVPRYYFLDRSGRVVASEYGYDEGVAGRMEASVQAALTGVTAG